MAYNVVPTVATGDSWTAAQHNTYIRDNFSALFPFLAAGDMPYASGVNTLARLAKPSVASLLYMLNAGVPTWLDLSGAGDLPYGDGATVAKLAKPGGDSILKNTSAGALAWLSTANIPGRLHTWATYDFNPDSDFSGAWADIPYAGWTLILGTACDVFLIGSVKCYNSGTGRLVQIRGYIDGNTDANYANQMNGGENRNENQFYIYSVANVAAGSRICKLQAQADTNPTHITSGRFFAFAFVH